MYAYNLYTPGAACPTGNVAHSWRYNGPRYGRVVRYAGPCRQWRYYGAGLQGVWWYWGSGTKAARGNPLQAVPYRPRAA